MDDLIVERAAAKIAKELMALMRQYRLSERYRKAGEAVAIGAQAAEQLMREEQAHG